MTTYTLNLLGHIASKALQTKYLVNGTQQQYLVLDQLIEDAYYYVNHPITLKRGVDTSALKTALDNLELGEGETLESIVEHNASWNLLRCTALRHIEGLGISFAAWESSELLEMDRDP